MSRLPNMGADGSRLEYWADKSGIYYWITSFSPNSFILSLEIVEWTFLNHPVALDPPPAGPSRHLGTTETGAFSERSSLKSDSGHKECRLSPLQLVPLCFMSPFFSILIDLLPLHPVPFIKAFLSHLPRLIIRSKQSWYFPHFSPCVVASLDTELHLWQELPFQKLDFPLWKKIPSSCAADIPPAVAPWFSCRALRVRTQPDFPSAWCHFSLAVREEEEKKEQKQK